MSDFKRLFSRALAAAPGRLHMAAHSHHLWPDATYDAQVEAWEDAARLADRKWDKALGEVWPAAQGLVARELGLPSPQSVVFAPNTHSLLVALVSAVEGRPVRVLASDGEFHSFRRQAARWAETGAVALELVAAEPFATFPQRFAARARSGGFDLIFVSQVFFRTGAVFEDVWALAELSRPQGPWLVVDGYHGFRAVPTDLAAVADRCFYLAGGYKYAMAGEGAAFLHAPPGFAPRPAVSGWYAEFGELEGPAGGVGYARDATRFLGSTFDPSGLYRFVAAGRMLEREGLTTAAIAAHVAALQEGLVARIAAGAAGRLAEAELLNPLDGRPHARFLAFRHPEAQAWKAALMAAEVVTDVRDDVLRVGLSLYHEAADLERFCAACRAL
nr:class V aminotransferase [Phenylobacterium hankyongense]